jgi:hypothetical protein
MTNKDKVIFYMIYLQGSAYDWFKPILTNFLENGLGNQKVVTTTTFNSYITFKTNLKKMYRGVDGERIIEQQL